MFLSDHLPKEFAYSLSKVMMPRLCSTIRSTWLDTAVPVALDEMTNFRKAIALVQLFSDKIKTLGWIGADELEDWVSHSPKIWLTKRRETSLDWTRNNLAFGKFLVCVIWSHMITYNFRCWSAQRSRAC